MTFRYWPYKGNRYHELRVAAGTTPGDVALVIVKDVGSNTRVESITVRAGDVEHVIDEIRAHAQPTP